MGEVGAARALRARGTDHGPAHPNIVPVHEIARDNDGNPYYTESSLADILDAERLTLGQHIQNFLKVLDAVAFAHSRGVIHRDLKPANIMIGEFGEVLGVDSGLAKVLDRITIRGKNSSGPGQSAPQSARYANRARGSGPRCFAPDPPGRP